MKRIFLIFHIHFLFFMQIYAQNAQINLRIDWLPERKILYAFEQDEFFVDYPYFKNYELDVQAFLRFSHRIEKQKLGIRQNVDINSLIITDFKSKVLDYRNTSFFRPISKDSLLSDSVCFFWQDEQFIYFSLPPAYFEHGKFFGLTDIQLQVNYSAQQNFVKSYRKYAAQSVLSTGRWYKIKLAQSGVYALSYAQLQALGFSNPQNVRVFGSGGKQLSKRNDEAAIDDLPENKVLHYANRLYFFAQGIQNWEYNAQSGFFEHQNHEFSDYTYYFLSDINTGFDNLINTSNTNLIADIVVTDYQYFDAKESDLVNLVKSGRTWYGDAFDVVDNLSYSFSVSNLVSSKSLNITIKAAARSVYSSSLVAEYNNQNFSMNFFPITGSYEAAYAAESERNFSFSAAQTAEHEIKLRYNKQTPSAKAWLDFIRINAWRQLLFSGNTFQFRNAAVVSNGKVAEFRISATDNNFWVWNISQMNAPKAIDFEFAQNTASFKYDISQIEEFIVFNPEAALEPIINGENTGFIDNQNLHAIAAADMLIVAPEAFMDEAQKLADFHAATDNLVSIVVNLNQIYNEFSSGTPDVAAIRNFVRMVYQKSMNSAHPLRLLTLFGDGTYKNKEYIAANRNIIPTYQSINSIDPIASYVSDDFFGLLDENEYETVGNLDIGIGRIPVDNKIEAADYLNKILAYYSDAALGAWKNVITLLADDEDGNTYFFDAESYAQIIEQKAPYFQIDKIYLDAYEQQTTAAGDRYPDVVRALNERMQQGSLIINYIGHGNEYRLAHEKIIDIEQINSWTNFFTLPVFVTATCEFSRYDNSDITTAGEYVLLNKKGGAIALFSTTRLVFSGSNDELNTNFYQLAFELDTINNKQLYLGDIVKRAKNLTGTPANINKRNFSLLGDPAVRLLFPLQNARILKWQAADVVYDANEQAIVVADTVRALSALRVEGAILAENKQINEQFTGEIIPVVYDKPMMRKTRANDGGLPQTFYLQNNYIFKGNASVNGGRFVFDFIVPKDINPAYGNGKLNLYFFSADKQEGAGFFKSFIIGGIDTLARTDIKGPEIKLYLNDEKFVSGGMSNQNPIILALLSDSSGINTSGASIGHDIVAVIDDDAANSIVLNRFYESEKNNFRSGKIYYQLQDLSAGEHTLKLKAWDVYNNSTEKTINFVVASNEGLQIRHLFNYPNPFFSQTAFHFEHNLPNTLFIGQIQIFSITGILVKTIPFQLMSSGYLAGPLFWDGKDEYGNNIGRGTYFYRINLKTNEGKSATKMEKLVILN